MTRTPWFVWSSLASVSLILFGVYWDISWHMSIGRDSFWTPAHIAIQLGGITAALAGAFLIFSTTFRRDAPLRASSITVLGFRGPLGAFVAAWGGATMVVSAPFDNWWHNAYGLDVKILSPPHAVLTLGILGVAIGGVLLVLATRNRHARPERLDPILLVIAGEVLVLGMISILEHTFRSNLHRADAYRAMAIVAPLTMLPIARATGRRWGTTLVAATYTAFMVLGIWICPLVGAEPKLGPVYQPITHLVPLEFPMLIIAPAFVIDLIAPRIASRWAQVIVSGVVFVAVLVAVEWPFSAFLQTEAARNYVFGTMYFPYFERPEWADPQYRFIPDPRFAIGLAWAALFAIGSSGLGILLGDAMKKVRR